MAPTLTAARRPPPPASRRTRRRRAAVGALHAELGDCNASLRGVLHQCAAGERFRIAARGQLPLATTEYGPDGSRLDLPSHRVVAGPDAETG
ncbi:hypothetical protein [Streptomyces noursei]|uniref:hypothetical protein n=1 Tax=Streptomyces noursei TaxID=1971 RepID=UPI00167C0E6B|nr:hypothetical protein GCM10010341_49500 [Streptomyces noursei]